MRTIFSVAFGILFTCSCMSEEGCKKGKAFLRAHHANIVLYEKPKKTFEDYKLIGKDLTSGRDTMIRLGGRWYATLGYIWDSGDTVVKNKGELIITVKKQGGDTHYSEWTCEGIYLDGKSVSTGVPKSRYGK